MMNTYVYTMCTQYIGYNAKLKADIFCKILNFCHLLLMSIWFLPEIINFGAYDFSGSSITK